MVERKKERERKRDRHEGVVAIDWPQEGAREGGQKGSVQGQDQNQTPRRGERCNRETEELARTRTGIWERGGPGFGDCNGLLGGPGSSKGHEARCSRQRGDYPHPLRAMGQLYRGLMLIGAVVLLASPMQHR
jgi:hypothetical protein